MALISEDNKEFLKRSNIKKLAEKLYIAKLTGAYTVRGFQKGLYEQCLEEAKRLIEYKESI